MSDLRNKLQNIDPNLGAQDIKAFMDDSKQAVNIYEALNVIAKRARLLSHELKRLLRIKSKSKSLSSTKDFLTQL